MDSGKQAPNSNHRHTPKRRNLYRGVTAEISLKLILSWVIALSAIASFFRLLPYHLTQKAKLKELRIQVEETDSRVVKLREQLNHNFDPQQTKNLMEQYSTLTELSQSRIYWLENNESKTNNQ